MNPIETLSVSQLNRQARVLLDSHFDYVWVEGEISNLAQPGSGHWYFSLKDDSAQVRCAMFRNRNQRVRLQVSNGDAVRLRVRVSLYEGRGEFQLIVEHLEPAGAGALQAAFLACKAKLQAEGLFDEALKKPLPDTVQHLGVITSPTGAAIHDILTTLHRRFPAIAVSILPTSVQGERAASEIVAAIERANRWHMEGNCPLDALIVGRGGGSQEDLQAFNEESVARAIAASALPIVSAVGHEVDFSIADMVADVRAATPSAAAELLSPDQALFGRSLAEVENRLIQLMGRQISTLGTHLKLLRRSLQHPGQKLREQSQRLDDLEQRLVYAQKHTMRHQANKLQQLNTHLLAVSPTEAINTLKNRLDTLKRQLSAATDHQLTLARSHLQHLMQMLDSLSPLGTLERGYAIVQDERGEIVVNSQQVSPGNRVKARLHQGSLDCEVVSITPGPENA